MSGRHLQAKFKTRLTEAVRRLEALIIGLQRRSLHIRHRGKTLDLHPEGLVVIELKALAKGDASTREEMIRLSLLWARDRPWQVGKKASPPVLSAIPAGGADETAKEKDPVGDLRGVREERPVGAATRAAGSENATPARRAVRRKVKRPEGGQRKEGSPCSRREKTR